jgi:hypothetical protein
MTPIDLNREINEILDATLAELDLTRGAVPAATYCRDESAVLWIPFNVRAARPRLGSSKIRLVRIRAKRTVRSCTGAIPLPLRSGYYAVVWFAELCRVASRESTERSTSARTSP